MKNSVSFSIYDKYIEVTSFLDSVDGLAYRHKPVEMAFDSHIDALQLVEVFLTFSSTVAVQLFASWLYDRLKNDINSGKSNDRNVTINGNTLSGKNITVVQIVNIVSSEAGHSRNSIMTLAEFGDLLDGLPVGQTGILPYSVYATFFPPGEPDQGARTRAFDFARAHGCEINNQTSAQQVVFARKITNPAPRTP